MDQKIAAIIGVTGLMVFPSEPQFYVLCAVVCSSVSAVILQILKGRQDDRRREHEDERYDRDRAEREAHQREVIQRYEHAAELTIAKAAEVKQEVGLAASAVKREVAVAQAITATAAKELKTELGVNTTLTRVAVQKADRAYDAANHVNEKIASLASGEGTIEAITTDTNEVVHRLEEVSKLDEEIKQ